MLSDSSKRKECMVKKLKLKSLGEKKTVVTEYLLLILGSTGICGVGLLSTRRRLITLPGLTRDPLVV